MYYASTRDDPLGINQTLPITGSGNPTFESKVKGKAL